MPRLPWPISDLDALDAESLQRKWDDQISSLRTELAPKSTPTPAPSFDLADWSPWRQQAATPEPQTGAVPPSAPGIFDDPGWFPWRQSKPASGTPAAMPTAPQQPDVTMTQGQTQLPAGATIGPANETGRVGSAPMSRVASAGTRASRFANEIAQVSREEGVPEDVLAAIVDTEDSDENSVSPAGARGITQVVPGQGFDLPGEDASDPLTSIRQGARALKEKARMAGGDWAKAGRLYFGEGVDAGGMDTDTYGARFDANRARYGQPAAQTSSGSLNIGDVAQRYAGGTYTFGGGRDEQGGIPGAKDTDCSGFVSSVWRENGVDLPAHTDAAYAKLRQVGARQVSEQDALPGDVVFYMGGGYGGNVTYHMGIYAGPGQILDASQWNGDTGVRLRPISHAGGSDDIVILRDPRVNGRPDARTSEAPPKITPSGIAESPLGERLTQTAGSSPAGPPPSAPAGSVPPAGASDLEGELDRLRADPNAQQPQMLRGPLQQAPAEATPEMPYDPRDADQGAHEAGYTASGYEPGAAASSSSDGGAVPDSAPTYEVVGAGPTSEPPQEGFTRVQNPNSQSAEMPVAERPQPTPAPEIAQQSMPTPNLPGMGDLVPVIDQATGKVKAWLHGAADAVQGAVDHIGQNIQGNQEAVRQANEATGAPDANPLAWSVDTVGTTLAGPGGLMEPMGGAPRMMARMQEIESQAAQETGFNADPNEILKKQAVRDPGWRARNPDLAQEYDDLNRDFGLAIIGQVGDTSPIRQIRQQQIQNAARRAEHVVEDVAPAARERQVGFEGMPEPDPLQPRQSALDAAEAPIPSISDAPNAPRTLESVLGNEPVRPGLEPTLPGMEAPPVRAEYAGNPNVSDAPNRVPNLGDIPPSQVNQGMLPGMNPIVEAARNARPIGEIAEEIGAGWKPQKLSAAVQRQQKRSARAARMAEMRGEMPPPSAMDWIKSVGYSSMIGPSTALVNVFGNGLELAWNVPKEAARAIARGRPNEFVQEMKGAATGFMRASGAVFDAMAGHPVSGEAAYPTLSERVEGPIARGAATVLEAGGRLFSQAPDAFFRSIGESMGRAREAAQIATAEMRAGTLAEKDWTRRVNQLLDEVGHHEAGGLTLNPDAVDQIIKAGGEWADRLTLRGPMGPKGTALRDAVNKIGPIGHLILPFVNTPYQMTQRLLERTPGVGARMGTQPNRLDRVYDQVGGALVMAGVTGLGMAGLVTGSGPSDPEQRQMLRSQGWQPNSTLVAGRWVPNNVWGVFGPMFDAAGESADWYRYQKKDATAGQQMADAVKRAGTIFQNQAYLRGVGDLINAIKNPEVGLQSYLGSTAARLLPYAATGRTIAGAIDPVERSPERARDVGLPEAIRQGLKMSVPGLRQDLPAMQDSLGRPVENERSGAAAILPRNRQPKPDVTVQAFSDAGVDIGYPRNTMSMDGIDFELTPREQRQWQRYRGEILERFTPGLTQRSWWSNPAARKIALEDLMQQANGVADAKVQKDIGAAQIQRRVKDAMQKKKAS